MQERLENEVELPACIRIRHELRVNSIKINIMGNRGYPDRCFLLPLRPAWIEFKRFGKKPTPLQYYRLWEMNQLGYDATWSDNADDAYKWIKALLAARLSEKGDQNSDPASVCGTVIRSGAGENLYIPRRNEVTSGKTRDKGSSSGGTPEGGL